MDNGELTLLGIAAATAKLSPRQGLYSMIGLLVDRLSYKTPPCSILHLFEISGDRNGVKFWERVIGEPLHVATFIRALAVAQAETSASRFQIECHLQNRMRSAALAREPWFLDRTSDQNGSADALGNSMIDPARAVAWLCDNPFGRDLIPQTLLSVIGKSDANARESGRGKQPLPPELLRRHLRSLKVDNIGAPASDDLYRKLKMQFPEFRVSREIVRKACVELWGEQPPGRRTKRR